MYAETLLALQNKGNARCQLLYRLVRCKEASSTAIVSTILKNCLIKAIMWTGAFYGNQATNFMRNGLEFVIKINPKGLG